MRKKIVFLGTPDFAVACLEKIVQAGFNVVAVVTATDKQSGRGLKVSESPVKKFALQNQLPVLQPEKLKAPEFIQQIKTFAPDIMVVVAFRMMPKELWVIPPLGTINLHASLLPDYRGAAPIQRVIMNGEKKTGLTTFFINEKIDTGDLLLSKKIDIGNEETAGELHDRMKIDGAELLVETLQKLEDGTINSQPQTIDKTTTLHQAPKIFRSDCKIDWAWKGEKIFNHIRGLSPYPSAFFEWENKSFKVFKAKVKPLSSTSNETGQTLSDQKTFLRFVCQDNEIEIEEIQPEGKKRMNIQEFLRGRYASKK